MSTNVCVCVWFRGRKFIKSDLYALGQFYFKKFFFDLEYIVNAFLYAVFKCGLNYLSKWRCFVKIVVSTSYIVHVF